MAYFLFSWAIASLTVGFYSVSRYHGLQFNVNEFLGHGRDGRASTKSLVIVIAIIENLLTLIFSL